MGALETPRGLPRGGRGVRGCLANPLILLGWPQGVPRDPEQPLKTGKFYNNNNGLTEFGRCLSRNPLPVARNQPSRSHRAPTTHIDVTSHTMHTAVH